MILTLVLILVIAAGLTPLIIRDLEHAVRRRRQRELLAPYAAAFDTFAMTLAAVLLPAMREAVRAGAEMEKALRKAAETMRAGSKKTLF